MSRATTTHDNSDEVIDRVLSISGDDDKDGSTKRVIDAVRADESVVVLEYTPGVTTRRDLFAQLRTTKTESEFFTELTRRRTERIYMKAACDVGAAMARNVPGGMEAFDVNDPQAISRMNINDVEAVCISKQLAKTCGFVDQTKPTRIDAHAQMRSYVMSYMISARKDPESIKTLPQHLAAMDASIDAMKRQLARINQVCPPHTPAATMK